MINVLRPSVPLNTSARRLYTSPTVFVCLDGSSEQRNIADICSQTIHQGGNCTYSVPWNNGYHRAAFADLAGILCISEGLQSADHLIEEIDQGSDAEEAGEGQQHHDQGYQQCTSADMGIYGFHGHKKKLLVNRKLAELLFDGGQEKVGVKSQEKLSSKETSQHQAGFSINGEI